MIIDHNHPGYKKLRRKTGRGKYNGCYYYSKEIVENIIPRVKTWRGWNTVGKDVEGMCDHMIVFLHDNSTPWHYEWLHKYDDFVLVCSSKYTRDSVKYSGHTILLPMSVDVEYVRQFKTEKTKDTCFVGNVWVKDNLASELTGKVDFFRPMKREKLLKKVAKYRRAYAIDRCALECKALGCELLEIETRYHCDGVGELVDNREAAVMLQKELDKLDGGDMREKYRVMRRGDSYEIELQDEPGSWTVVGECNTIEAAKEMLADLKNI